MRRPIAPIFLLLCATIALGLASRHFAAQLPTFVAQYAGDTLWATMMFWALALIFPRRTTLPLAVGAVLISFAVECSQLYHASWIDSIRSTRLGALALGSGFLWTDLLCYVVGVGLAVAMDAVLWRDKSANGVNRLTG